MKRILLIAAMLLPVASALATEVLITADVNTAQFKVNGVGPYHKTVTIKYVATVDVRAFALDINVDNGMNIGDANVRDYNTGESIDPSIIPGKKKGYGIFPGRFRDFVNPSNPDPCYAMGNYNPTTPWDSPGAENTGLGWPRIVVELGTLWATGSGDINKPALSGTLFTFDVNSEDGNDCNMTVAVNALRGSIVGNTGAAITDTNLPFTKKITFQQGCTVPNCIGLTSLQCIAAIGAAGFSSWKEDSVPGTGQALHQVIWQLQTPGTSWPCDTRIDFNEVNWPIKPTASFYGNWLLRGRPACWAYPRQCRGDVDGKKQLQYWVGSNDLNFLRSAKDKLESVLPPIPGGICADFTHSKQLQYWVGSNDLNILRSFKDKLESLVPLCGNVLWPCSDPNYNYWCLPTGVTCPPGQYCGPPGICPNSP